MALKSLQSKKLILFVALGLTVFILYLYFYVGAANFVEEIRQANLYYYTSAFLAFFMAAFFSAVTWHTLLEALGLKSSFRRVLFLTWSGYFLDATLPEPGWSGDISKAYMLSKKDNADAGKTIASVVGQKIIGMAVTIFILVVGFGLLSLNARLPQEVLIFFGILMAISVFSFLLVFYLSRSPRATKSLVNGLLIPVMSFFLRRRFDAAKFREEAEHFLTIFHEGIATLTERKRALLRPVAFYITSVVFDVSIVFFVFASLGYPIPVDKVLIVYALTGTLASIGVSFVGLTEIIMTTAYQVLSIPLAVSFSVTLLTRIVTLWFKLIAGYVTFQWASISIMIGKRRGEPSGKIDGGSAPTAGGP